MGYRSEVYLCCAGKAFEKFETAYKSVYEGKGFLPTEILKDGENRLLHWSWVKWYSEFEGVKAVTNVINELDDLNSEEYAYKLIEIGEEGEADIYENEYGADMFENIVPISTIYMGNFHNKSKLTDINAVSKKFFGRDTLESRGSDSLDFLETSVWTLQSALEKAYELGRESMK